MKTEDNDQRDRPTGERSRGERKGAREAQICSDTPDSEHMAEQPSGSYDHNSYQSHVIARIHHFGQSY